LTDCRDHTSNASDDSWSRGRLRLRKFASSKEDEANILRRTTGKLIGALEALCYGLESAGEPSFFVDKPFNFSPPKVTHSTISRQACLLKKHVHPMPRGLESRESSSFSCAE
jgi:hypothetical protein